MVSFVQSYLSETDDKSLMQLMLIYSIVTPSSLDDKDFLSLIRKTIEDGEAQGKNGLISFDDQIYLPIKWELPLPQHSIVMVDECQDLSRAKLELTLRTCKPNGRMFYVGDSSQAIYSFAGADFRSFQNIIDRTKATILPLSISYRCPKSIITEAKKIVKEIEAHESAEEGEVVHTHYENIFNLLQPGDMVLCRLTAPLISLCIELIRHKIPAKVKGRNIADTLVKMAKEALKKRPWKEFIQALDEYSRIKILSLMQHESAESAIQSFEDRIDGLKACFDAFPEVKDIKEFQTEIESLFSDEKSPIELSTIHRAKGLENDNVFIIKPKTLPLRWKNQTKEQAQQERNLKYVCITRAKKKLYWVHDTKLAIPSEEVK